MPEKIAVVVTCEHATPFVPGCYAFLFEGRRGILATHRAYDRGSLELARRMARFAGAKLFAGRVTRLLVDLNTSPGHRGLFSSSARTLPPGEQERLLQRYYHPYREAVAGEIERTLAAGQSVLHLAVHTFAPVLRGRRRAADIGLLYDPRRMPERLFCRRWRAAVLDAMPSLQIRMNYPYRGTADGLTSALRRRFPPAAYMGVELEANQRHCAPAAAGRREKIEKGIIAGLAGCLAGALAKSGGSRRG
jgi:predicted N-formylglutamate amidohydrolase